MRLTLSYARLKYVAAFVCVSFGAFVLSSLALSLLESKLGPVRPQPLVRAAVAKKYAGTKISIDLYRSIWEKNIFSTSADKTNDGSKPFEVDRLSLTSLDCSLVGTIIPENGDGWAIILDNDGNAQSMVTVGSSLKGARVEKILKDKVVLTINGRDELLTMDMEERSAQSSRTSRGESPPQGQVLTYTVGRNLVQENLNDLATVMSKVRVEPYFAAGKAEGFRISQIQPGSFIGSMGFQSGDIIKSVNGRDIATAQDAMGLYEAMRGGSFFRVGIVRDGSPKTIQIRVR